MQSNSTNDMISRANRFMQKIEKNTIELVDYGRILTIIDNDIDKLEIQESGKPLRTETANRSTIVKLEIIRARMVDLMNSRAGKTGSFFTHRAPGRATFKEEPLCVPAQAAVDNYLSSMHVEKTTSQEKLFNLFQDV